MLPSTGVWGHMDSNLHGTKVKSRNLEIYRDSHQCNLYLIYC